MAVLTQHALVGRCHIALAGFMLESVLGLVSLQPHSLISDQLHIIELRAIGLKDLFHMVKIIPVALHVKRPHVGKDHTIAVRLGKFLKDDLPHGRNGRSMEGAKNLQHGFDGHVVVKKPKPGQVSEETESEVPEGAVGELVAQIEKDGPTESGTTEDNTTWYSYANVFSSDDYAPVAAEKAVNAAEVYANLEYEPAMFYGTYHMSFLESDELEAPYDPNKTFLDSCEWVPYEDMFGEGSFFWEQIATVPHYMCAGYGSATWSPLLTLKEYEWCQLYFAVKDEDGELSHEQYMADYSVSGSTITYHILDNYYYDRTTEVLTYEFKGTIEDKTFLIYINTKTGKEENILILLETEGGLLTI